MQKLETVFIETLNSMPKSFSTTAFNKALRKRDFPKALINGGKSRIYLQYVSEKSPLKLPRKLTTKTWYKADAVFSPDAIDDFNSIHPYEDQDNEKHQERIEKYYEALIELYELTKEPTTTLSMARFIHSHKLSSVLTGVLKRGGLLKSVQIDKTVYQYQWNTIYPTKAMAEKVIEECAKHHRQAKEEYEAKIEQAKKEIDNHGQKEIDYDQESAEERLESVKSVLHEASGMIDWDNVQERVKRGQEALHELRVKEAQIVPKCATYKCDILWGLITLTFKPVKKING